MHFLWFRNLRIRHKLFLAYGAILIIAAIAGALVSSSFLQRSIEVRVEQELNILNGIIVNMVKTAAEVSIKNHLRAVATSNRQMVGSLYRTSLRGEITDAEAKERARSFLLSQNIGRTGYIFVWDVQKAPETIPLAVHPKIEGRDVASVDFVQEGASLREGYMEYQWKNPDEAQPRSKAMHLVYFHPWKWVIAVSSYKDEFLELIEVDDFQQSILSITLDRSGYCFILDTRGNVIIHPQLKGNIYYMTDDQGRPVVQEICSMKSGRLVYSWRNPGEKRSRDKLALFSYIPEYDWIVASSSYVDEFSAPAVAVRNIVLICMGVSLLLALFISFGVGSMITRPMQQLINAFQRSQDEKVPSVMPTESRDEIGQLTHCFNSFLKDIERETAERERAEEEKDRLQTQLLQAQKMEAVGRLAGGIAHDFNNMLQAIMGHADLALMSTEQGSSIHSHLQLILDFSKRSADIVRQLLGFARKQPVNPVMLDLNDTIGDMLKMLRRIIGESVNLAWLPGHELWKVRMDPSQIDQILANLTVNARDAVSGAGMVTIETHNVVLDEVYCAQLADAVPGEYVLISVTDDGCGMDAETLERVFEPFFTTKGVKEGTGLGLSTVYGIVRQNGGLINVYSEPGKGSVFRIYLPRTVWDEDVTSVDKSPEPTRGGTETIVMVEDEESILQTGRKMLEGLGYTVLPAQSSEEALALVESYRETIDLLITDVVLPHMNGWDLSKRIGALRPGIQCLFMSGYAADVLTHEKINKEAVFFISKPFSLGQLAEKVRDVLDRKGMLTV